MVGVTSDLGGGGVFAEERQDNIARIVEGHGRARVSDLAAQFGVSGVTIRKDLAALEMQGRLVRTHGGAMATARARSERAFDVRERLQSNEKEAIGRAAAGPGLRRRERSPSTPARRRWRWLDESGLAATGST